LSTFKGTKDIIIGGDFNQNIASDEVQQFFQDIGIQDAHSLYNKIPLNDLDPTNIKGIKPIDSIAVTSGIMKFVEGVKLLDNNDVVISDHRAYVMDLNVEEYFQDQFSSWDTINKVVLNPSRKSYRSIFFEELESQLNIYDIEGILEKSTVTYKEIEKIDNLITKVLNAATNKVEGQSRNIPYTKEKVKR